VDLVLFKNRFEINPGGNNSLEKALVKKGFVLDKRRMTCYTRLPEVAKNSGATTWDEEVKTRIRRHEMAIAFSQATSGDGFNYPVPEGQSYLPFQQVGIAYIHQHQYTLLADDPGLGKTIQAIGYLNSDRDVKKTLIICPAMLRLNWKKELRNWLVYEPTIDIGDTSYIPETDIAIISYEALAKQRPLIDSRNYDLIAADEVHMVKDCTTKRGRAFWGKVNRGIYVIPRLNARKMICMTGTPMLNRPVDVWEYCQAFDPNGLGAVWTHFAYRYCAAWDAPWGFDYSGASNLEELQFSLRGSFMIRRKKSEVLKDLPPKRRQIVTITPDEGLLTAVKRERELFERNIIKINRAIDRAEEEQPEGDEKSYKETAKKLINLKMGEDGDRPLFSELAGLRHATALAKLSYAVTYIKLMLEEHEKVVVFAHHLDLLNGLYKEFERDNFVLLTGEVSMEERNRRIEQFQTNPKCRGCICGLTLAIGITLTAADYGLLLELDWRQAIITQAEDRLHRIGQKESVLIQHLVFEESVDCIIVKRVIKKQEDAEMGVG
jgi:SWI/SNF-related matrix-associated actin-dependent regulator 1 of chromatin subfamily A